MYIAHSNGMPDLITDDLGDALDMIAEKSIYCTDVHLIDVEKKEVHYYGDDGTLENTEKIKEGWSWSH